MIFTFPVVLAVGTLLLAAWLLRSYLRLRHIPGPWLSALTNVPRSYWVWTNRSHDIHIDLHRKYGRLVRFGPNMISVTDPQEIPHIYSFAGTFGKSDFYRALAFYVRGKPVETIFATQNEQIHHLLRRPIAGMYSMSNVVSFEPYVDSTIKYLFERLDEEFVHPGRICNFETWLQYFAFDVIGELTFSKRLGFLQHGGDVDGIIHAIDHYFNSAAIVSQIPWVDWLWAKNPIVQRFRKHSVNPIVAFALARAAERQNEKKEADGNARTGDFLSQFLGAIEKDPSIPPWALTAWTTSNVGAGSDTTAILLRTIIYQLLKHPECLARLLGELQEARQQGQLSDIVTWREARELRYLDAVIKESGRLHPPFGLPFERVVPPEGAVICGQAIPGGSVVGISAWAIHRDPETFGADSDEWKPERWLCDEKTRRKMDNALMTFGAGRRVCLGKHISYLEVYKLIPTLFQRYEFSFAHPDSDRWEVKNRWFVHQTGLDVRIKYREEQV
ncbi:cytochrome P450 [Aspergillus ibericus CBS 121593]|uniref:Putative benzoate 4-monooxygenase cytochrome P450 n=1 Tax=Aspergillus ibericus CBS 121593 TaxID=1448316 RepID=A0A395GY69_9EURO|nr:putative benzoate 4-monooxygenase cytochrome P450 [Aspergillus ibericus CBS 121593]RAK98993.1 putative benzoate 4-monooxygenase cytochrome P450 [Aspergillus ibericus CBS 121593]